MTYQQLIVLENFIIAIVANHNSNSVETALDLANVRNELRVIMQIK